MTVPAMIPPNTIIVVNNSMTSHKTKIGRILFHSPKMSKPWTMAENKTNTKSVIVIGSVPHKVLMTPKTTVYRLDSKTLSIIYLTLLF